MTPANDNMMIPWAVQFTAGPCCECGWPLDVISAEPAPLPGDATLCSECAAINIFTDRLTLRKPTAAEQHRAAADPDMAALKDVILRTNAAVKEMARC